MYDEALLKEMMEVPEIAQALELSKESAYTKEQLEAYDKYWDMVRVEKTLIADAKNEGKAEGILEGKIEMITALFDKGIDVSQIAKLAKMTDLEIITILKNKGRTV